LSQRQNPHVLVFEPDARGHACEWLMHLLQYARENAPALEVTLAVPRSLAEEIIALGFDAAAPRFELLPLTAQELALCTHTSLTVSGLARWYVARRYVRRAGAGAVLFLSIDHLTLALALMLPLGGAEVLGILFRPSVHYGEFGRYGPTLGERIRDFRKAILYPLMLLHPRVSAILSLDPYFPPYARRRYRQGRKVYPVPDPMVSVGNGSPDILPSERLPGGRRAFLLFGVLTERKGVLALLRALPYLSRETVRKMAIVIAGRLDPAIRETVCAQIAHVARTRPDLSIDLMDRYLSLGEIETLVRRSAVILAPYQRFVGSSGVLIWAARLGRPVITQDFGLLGQQVREYGLGLAVDTTNAQCLAGALEAAAWRDPVTLMDASGVAAFIRGRSPERFAAAVVDRIVADPD
jgi:glycosyltransferase involved in cell wall biosynthesis